MFGYYLELAFRNLKRNPGLTALMIGAVISTWAIGGGVLVAIPATVLAVVAVVAWGRRDSTRRLVARLRG